MRYYSEQAEGSSWGCKIVTSIDYSASQPQLDLFVGLLRSRMEFLTTY
jgi:hypothetical protein